MRLIRREVVLLQHSWSTHDHECPKGSGYCVDQGVTISIRDRIFVGALLIRDRVLEQEEMPSWAWIQRATLGSTEWKSKLKNDPRLTANK